MKKLLKTLKFSIPYQLIVYTMVATFKQVTK